MTRRIKRGIPWPEGGRTATKEVGPFPPWEVFRKTTFKKYFPNSHSPILPEDEEIFEEFYRARRLYQRNDPEACAVMGRWLKEVEKKRGEDFFAQYGPVLEIIKKETATPLSARERKF